MFWIIKIVIVYSLPWNENVFLEGSFNKHAKLTFEYFDTWVTEDVIFNNILLSNKLVQIIYKEQVNDLSSIWFYLKYRQSILHSRRIPFGRLFGVVILNRYLSLLIYTSHCTKGKLYVANSNFSVATLNLCSIYRRWRGIHCQSLRMRLCFFPSLILFVYQEEDINKHCCYCILSWECISLGNKQQVIMLKTIPILPFLSQSVTK